MNSFHIQLCGNQKLYLYKRELFESKLFDKTEFLELELFLTIKLYLCLTELFEIELFICFKMDLALNILQKLIFYKIQTNKQTSHVAI